MPRLKLLGTVVLEDEDGPVEGAVARRHPLALLALLACSPGRAVDRSKLVGLLWPEIPEDRARTRLNTHLYQIRRQLGEEVLLSAGEQLRLDEDVLVCDVCRFREAMEAGRFERAVDLYEGPLMDGFRPPDSAAFEQWVDRERDRLRQACREALEALAEREEERGEPAAAARWWRKRAGEDPYDGRVIRRLMEALAAAGNRAAALRVARTHARQLEEELGTRPDAEVRQLVERLEAGEKEAPAAGSGPDGPDGEGDRATLGPGPSGTVVEPPKAARPGRAKPPESASPKGRHRALPDGGSPLLFGALILAGLFLGALILAVIRLGSGPPDTPAAADGPGIAVEDIARAVAREVDRRRRGDTAVRLPEHRTHNIAAYELYLRGRDPALLRSASGARQGLEYYRQAIALDSTYAAAWAGLARFSARVSTDDETDMSRQELLAQAEEAALRAVALDDSLAEAHAALGLVRMGAFEFAAAETHLKRAIDLDPGRARPREWLVSLYLWTRRPAEALAEAERALELDPLSPSANAEVARALVGNGRCDDALARLEELEALEPQLLRAADITARCHARNGKWRDAIAALRTRADQDAGPNRRALLGHMLGRTGEREEALRIRANLLERWRYDGGGAFPVAVVEAGLGDRDEAFAWLDRALEDRSLTGWPIHLTVMGLLREPLGGDPRFEGFFPAREGFDPGGRGS